MMLREVIEGVNSIEDGTTGRFISPRLCLSFDFLRRLD